MQTISKEPSCHTEAQKRYKFDHVETNRFEPKFVPGYYVFVSLFPLKTFVSERLET